MKLNDRFGFSTVAASAYQIMDVFESSRHRFVFILLVEFIYVAVQLSKLLSDLID